MVESDGERRTKKRLIAGFYVSRKGDEEKPFTIMDEIPGVTEHPILLTDGEGEDDSESWNVPGFGMDAAWAECYSLYRRQKVFGNECEGGWEKQIFQHAEIVELMDRLDAGVQGARHDS